MKEAKAEMIPTPRTDELRDRLRRRVGKTPPAEIIEQLLQHARKLERELVRVNGFRESLARRHRRVCDERDYHRGISVQLLKMW